MQTTARYDSSDSLCPSTKEKCGKLFCKLETHLIANKCAKFPFPFATYLFSDASSGNSTWLSHNNVAWSSMLSGIIEYHLRHLKTFFKKNTQIENEINGAINSQFYCAKIRTCVLFPHPVEPSITIDLYSAIFDKILFFDA